MFPLTITITLRNIQSKIDLHCDLSDYRRIFQLNFINMCDANGNFA